MSAETRYTVRRPRVDVAQLQRGLNGLPRVLAQMGWPSLRAGQDKVVSAIMAGRDCVVVLPTATGKTGSIVVPILALNECLLIFSPLISLMKDQVQNLRRQGVQAGCINSNNPSLSAEYLKDWVNGKLEVLIVAPERLRRDDFMAAMRARPPWAVAMDEAHCLSAWSMSFRSAYCDVGDFIVDINPKVVVSLTATCPPEVEGDIRRVMCIEEALKIVHYPRRENLDLRSSTRVDDVALSRAIQRVEGPCIVYCATTKNTEQLAFDLHELSGTEVGFYHGKLAKDARNHTQDRFMSGDLKIICATNAFGMGVDKADVRGVFHADFPGTIENYAQEVGRGGRDGKHTLCMAYFSSQALRMQEFLLACSNPTDADVRSMFRALKKLAGSGDTVHMSVDKIAYNAKLKNSNSAYACMQVLQGSQVVARHKADEKMCCVRFKNRIDDTRFDELHSAVLALGDKQKDGYYELDLLGLAAEMDRTEANVRSHINRLAKDGVVDFVPPERAAPTRLIGDENMIDYEGVVRRRQAAEDKLAEVVHLITEVDDAEKHAYLEAYFKVA